MIIDRFHERVTLTRRKVERWRDDDAKREALIMLDVYSDDAKEQDAVFVERYGLGVPTDVADGVWDLLRVALPMAPEQGIGPSSRE